MPDTERTRTTPGIPFIDGLDRKRDELLDFLRREPFRFGEDVHGRPVEIRKHVDRNARQREQPVADENDRRRQNEQAVAQAVGDQKSKHRRPSGFD